MLPFGYSNYDNHPIFLTIYCRKNTAFCHKIRIMSCGSIQLDTTIIFASCSYSNIYRCNDHYCRLTT
jgi:hypothetical protein